MAQTMTFRDTRYQQLVARPGQPVDPNNAPERARLAKAFASALDGLVQAQQSGLTGVDGLVARAVDAARAVTDQVLHFEANGITLDGDVLLPATPDSGAWVLQAWYAGLRGLTPLADLRAEDVRTLAAGLGQSRAGALGVDQLASWLWSSPVDSFRLDLRMGAVERIEALSGDANAARGALRTSWLETAGRAMQAEVQRGPRSAEIQQRERTWWTRATSGDLALADGELQALRAQAEDPSALFRMDVMLALAEAGWQRVLTPPLVARAIVRLVPRTFDADLRALTSLLSADEADFGRICVAELAHFPLGEALAKAAPLAPQMDSETLGRLQALFNTLTEPVATTFLQGLICRPEPPERLVPALGQLAQVLGLDVFLRLASPGTLPAAVRPLVGRVLLAAAPSQEEWAVVCANLPVPAFLEVLRATPVESLQPLLAAIPSAVAKADARERTHLVQWLTDPARESVMPREALVGLAEGFVSSGGLGWELRTIRLVADAALRLGSHANELMELMRSAKVPPEARVQLLEALARSPDHVTEALKWRMGEMFDAPEVRDRLIELRKRRQG